MSILCKFGLHDWQTLKSVSCKCHKDTIYPLMGTMQKEIVDAVTVLRKCRRCFELDAYLTDGSAKSGLDINSLRTIRQFDEVLTKRMG